MRHNNRFAPAAAAIALTLAAAGCGRTDAAGDPLPELQIDPSRVAVAGLSSGAYMAAQVHLALSGRISGAGLLAGGPWGCARGSLETALSACIKAQPALPDIAALADRAREMAAAGGIDPLVGLVGDRVLVMHGSADATVAPALAAASAALYRELAGDAEGFSLELDDARDFGHNLPTLAQGGDCGGSEKPYLGRCGFDAAGLLMDHLFEAPAEPTPEVAQGTLHRFEQSLFADADTPAQLADEGFLYVPPQCAEGKRCGLLVAFHGCEQNADSIGDDFVANAGFNQNADVAGVVVLYPQVRASYAPLNPKACWDWWGYTGANYDSRDGAQIAWVGRALDALLR